MKVAIAGAGLAGLTAATRLLAAGHDVAVLEGRDEVGGRSRSRSVDGGDVIELGGQHISRHHKRMRQLVSDAGLHIQRDRYLPGPVNWRQPDETVGRLIPRVKPSEVLALRRLLVGSHSIWSINRAATSPQRRDELDSLSVANWLDRLGISGSVRHLAECFVAGGGGGVDAREVSLLQFTDFLTRESSIARFALTGMGLHGHIVEGTGALCAHLANQIGARLRLNTTVTAVDQDARGVTLHTDDGDTVHGDQAIIAVPTPVLADIRFRRSFPNRSATPTPTSVMGRAPRSPRLSTLAGCSKPKDSSVARPYAPAGALIASSTDLPTPHSTYPVRLRSPKTYVRHSASLPMRCSVSKSWHGRRIRSPAEPTSIYNRDSTPDFVVPYRRPASECTLQEPNAAVGRPGWRERWKAVKTPLMQSSPLPTSGSCATLAKFVTRWYFDS